MRKNSPYVLFVFALFIASCGPKQGNMPQGASAPVEVHALQVRKDVVSLTEKYPALLVPLQEVGVYRRGLALPGHVVGDGLP